MKTILTIAGSDCSGGAGIQADIKTITAHKMYAMSVITALTAQNTTGVFGVLEADCEFVGKQMDAVFTDIFPDAVKIGMVSSPDIIDVIAKKLLYYKAKNIVVDPVMVSTSGSRLLQPEAFESLVGKLLPLSDVITPNILEAECFFSDMKIETKEDMLLAAEGMQAVYRGNILIKGGHLKDSADDLLYTKEKEIVWFPGSKIKSSNTHGTGCTLSSAIACNLAGGHSIKESIRSAKEYVTGALSSGLDLGAGNGPLNHCFNL